ncbi:putative transcriptional regulator [Fontibacillus solani]|uniref:Putative transcriptional regulator n=1 Tax=Fontibacillus solani TaxID=1572857 RepID=A0A7W3XQH0_9BACL|nr:hypothetical protein [Fontibacillus solani]MBA9084469.1 putative transcriptional regulator [Fontibacillus solani]
MNSAAFTEASAMLNVLCLETTNTNVDSSIQNYIQHAPKVCNTASCRDTIRVMFSYPESPCIVVCDKRDVPVGLVMSDKFYLTMCSRSGMDHYYNAPITKLMNRTPVTLDIHDSLHQITSSVNQRPIGMRNDSIIITSCGQYVGIIRPSDIQHLL